MFRPTAFLCFALGILLTAPAFADTMTLTVENVPSDDGAVFASLCGDPGGQFPGGCHTYVAVAPARKGTVVLNFKDIQPGVYAISALYDLNGNQKLDRPQDSYGFGNDAAYPPSFTSASVTVAGDATAHIRLVNPSSP